MNRNITKSNYELLTGFISILVKFPENRQRVLIGQVDDGDFQYDPDRQKLFSIKSGRDAEGILCEKGKYVLFCLRHFV